MAEKKRALSDEYATDQEVEAAIAGLSTADGERLVTYATYRALALAGTGLGMSAEDLLQEAIVRTLDGRKRWRRRAVSLVKHLKQAIRNITGHALAKVGGSRAVTVAEEWDADDPDAEVLSSSTHNGESVAAANEALKKIGETFESDVEVWLVMEALADGRKGPETQSDLNITATQYATITTRLKRGVDRKQGWRP